MNSLLQDVRHSLRSLARSPGFTAVAVATLALGIGANTAMFSIIDAALFRSLPYDRPGELVHLSESDRQGDFTTRNPVAPGNFLDWRQRQSSFQSLAAATSVSINLTGTETPERLLGAAVSWDLFPTLGVGPRLGRGFDREEDSPGAPGVVVLADGLWRRRFGADPAVLGRTISLANQPFTVVGVMPPRFEFPEPGIELWVPVERQLTSQEMHWRGSHYLEVVGRRKPGVTLAAARADLNRIAAAIRQENRSANSGGAAILLPLQESLVRGIRPSLIILLAAVGLVLAVACANVANLLLVRGTARAREIAVRRALGAGVGRIARLLVIESVLLALCGGAGAALLASACTGALLRIAPAELPRVNDIAVDWRVLGFTFAIAALTGLLFGLAPALLVARRDPRAGLQAGGAGAGAAPVAGRFRAALVAGEVALALMLTVAAGLAMRSLQRLQTLDAGFPVESALTARLTLPRETYAAVPARIAFYDRILSEIRALPGVSGAALTTNLPLTGTAFDNSFSIEGRAPRPDGRSDYALFRAVDADFLRVLGIPIQRGRGIEASDREESEPVAAINEAFARRYFAHADPFGARLTIEIGDNPRPRRIVGIVRDVRAQIDALPQPTMYVPYPQAAMRSMVVVVRTPGDARLQLEPLRRAILRADPDQPLHDVRTLPELLLESVLPWRFSTVLFGAFGGLALLLAGVGVYGVVSYSVMQRRRELGIRSALGAGRGHLMELVLRQAARSAVAGIAVGIAGAAAATPALSRLLYDTSPRDPATFAGTAVLLAAVALAACLPAARRAARTNPMEALRNE